VRRFNNNNNNNNNMICPPPPPLQTLPKNDAFLCNNNYLRRVNAQRPPLALSLQQYDERTGARVFDPRQIS